MQKTNPLCIVVNCFYTNRLARTGSIAAQCPYDNPGPAIAKQNLADDTNYENDIPFIVLLTSIYFDAQVPLLTDKRIYCDETALIL